MFCECRDIRVRYGRSVVLDIDRLEIPDGRITGVVGLNGAGKTTLLEVISLLRRPTWGELRLWGRPADGHAAGLRGDVVLVMHPGYLFRGGVWGNVLYGLKARGIRGAAAEARATEALRHVGMAGFARRDAAHLSAGERQRVNLARAIAIAPRAILLDEPTANVDCQTVEVIRRLLRELRDERGMTIVHTSPAGSALAEITDHFIELRNGRAHGPAGTGRP